MHNSNTVREKFVSLTNNQPSLEIRAPGRINIIGEHTDYNNGLVLPGAIDKALFFAARPNNSTQFRCWALDIDAHASIDIKNIKRGEDLWFNYLLGIADQFQQRGHQLPGLDVVFGGDLPVGAGVSSSAALESGMAMIWNELLNAKLSRVELAQLAQQSSHQFVGVPCGIMDQFASLNGREDHAILLDCRSLEFKAIPVAVQGCEWILLNSKVSHNLADSAYSQRVAECKEGLTVLQRLFPNITALRDVTPPQLEQHKANMSDTVYRRCRYIIGEHHRTVAMLKALSTGNAEEVGRLLNFTHMGLSLDYEVSCPEIEFFFRQALEHPGVYGARIMGGGFGGCTLNLVKSESRDEFVDQALTAYQQAFDLTADYLPVKLQDGVSLLS
jgi:galactokinase